MNCYYHHLPVTKVKWQNRTFQTSVSGSRRRQFISVLQHCGDSWNKDHSFEAAQRGDITVMRHQFSTFTPGREPTPLCSVWTHPLLLSQSPFVSLFYTHSNRKHKSQSHFVKALDVPLKCKLHIGVSVYYWVRVRVSHQCWAVTEYMYSDYVIRLQ